MDIERISDQVHVVSGTNVNWALVTEGDAVTVIDAGYPNDGRALLASLEAIGRRPTDVQAVLLTHAHLDHMGGIPALLDQHPVPVLTGPAEVPHAHREYQEQITPAEMLRQCRRVRGVVWVAQTLRAVLPHVSMSIPSAAPAPLGEPLDLPGGPTPIATPGHTTGHTAYLLADAGIVFTGDALVNAHPLLPGAPRPQLLPEVFSEDEARTRESLSTLAALNADAVVPGHGPVDRRPIQRVVDDVVAS